MKQIIVIFALLGNVFALPPPNCDLDGNYPDDENCVNYYSCADGVATPETCPWGLVFDESKEKSLVSGLSVTLEFCQVWMQLVETAKKWPICTVG